MVITKSRRRRTARQEDTIDFGESKKLWAKIVIGQ
jgi:hypothetical protein